MVTNLVLTLFLVGGALAQPVTNEQILRRLANDGPAKGNPKATVTLIEFADFQCSFCRKFWQTTLPRIETQYISSGKVRFVYRHFALLGKPSVEAAQAAECAHEQGKFWEYHDKLFASAGSPLAFTEGKLKGYAQEIKLKSKDFNQCLQSAKYLKKVDGETAAAISLGARGTPAFFLDGQMIVGAQPFEVFEAAIEKELKRTFSSGKPKSQVAH
jgi:protein-disulfide isomerase